MVPTIGESINAISHSTRQVLRGRGNLLDPNMLAEHWGENTLPAQAKEIIDMVRRYGLNRFSISANLTTDVLILQRVTEGAWPIKLDQTSQYRFFKNDESLAEGCLPQETASTVTYAVCRA